MEPTACVAAVTDCGSYLQHVVALAGGALALNLAYVNLERFRYAKTIQNRAREVLDKLDKAGAVPKAGAVKGIDLTRARSYRQLRELATFPGPNIQDGRPTDLGKEFRAIRSVYEWLFVKRIDIFVCSIFVAISVIALALGSGQPIGVLGWTCGYFGKEDIAVSYWTLAVGIVVPMVFLVVGGYIQSKCFEVGDRVEHDLGGIIQSTVTDADFDDDAVD